MAPVAGATLADTVDAGKKKKRSISSRAEDYRQACVFDGGTATVEKRPGGTSVSCTGGKGGDWDCVVHSKGDRCYQHLTNSPAPKAGGGGAVPPGGNAEDPNEPPAGDPVLQ